MLHHVPDAERQKDAPLAGDLSEILAPAGVPPRARTASDSDDLRRLHVDDHLRAG
jgi:hypothetical protein